MNITMKTLSAGLNKGLNLISPKKAEKVAESTIKDGNKLMAAGQDASAIQGKAMIKEYKKPEIEIIKVDEADMKAASNNPNPNPFPYEWRSDEEGV